MKVRFSALGLFVLTGCAVPKEAGFPDVARAVKERTGSVIRWNQGDEADAAITQTVRALLAHDLQPADAVEVALLENSHMQATYEDLMVSQADLVQAGLLHNPTLSGGVGWLISAGTGTPSYRVGVEQDFLDLLMIPARQRVATAQFEATKLRVGSEVLGLAHDVRTAYYALQGAQQIARMRQTILDSAQASIELARRQHDAGNTSDLDLGNEEALYEQIRLDLARSEAETAITRERLDRLMGLWGADARWTIAPELSPIPAQEPPLEHLESLAVKQRLDIGAARAAAQASSQALAAARDFRWIGAAGVGASLERDPEGRAVVGPTATLELPLFDQRQADIARREAELRRSLARLRATAVDARSEVREARGRVLASRGVVDRYRTTIIPLREHLVALSQQSYDAMLLGVYQLLAAKQAEVNAYREYIEAVRDYWIARVDLERAIGGRLGNEPTSAPVTSNASPAVTPSHVHTH